MNTFNYMECLIIGKTKQFNFMQMTKEIYRQHKREEGEKGKLWTDHGNRCFCNFDNKNQEHNRIMDKRHELKGNSARNINGF